jgi:hypothetical protein
MTDGQPASLSWNKAPFWGLRPDLYYCLTVAGLLIWGALSDERTGLSLQLLLALTSKFTIELSFISLRGPIISHHTEQFVYWSPISIVVEMPGDPKISRIHRNLC